MNVEEIFKQENPPGTKFLIELEVVEADGYSKVVSTAVVEDLINQFKNLTGCRVNKVFKKSIVQSDIDTESIETLLLKSIEKIQTLKNQGIPLWKREY